MSLPLRYRAHAKINLYLDVLERRRDGYHNIETIFQSVGLYDELTFSVHPSRLALTCSLPELSNLEQNLVIRAAQLLQEYTGCTKGAAIDLKKNIPLAAGLAGGSSNAAVTLIALNRLWELNLSRAELLHLARDIGSDVPFCTLGGTAAATHRGEELTLLPPIPPIWFVLLHPPITISTVRVYRHPDLGHSTERRFAGKTPSFRRALRALEQGDLAKVLFNRMEGLVFSQHPQLAEAKQRLLDAGCPAAAMSGSGSTVFGVCNSRAHAARVADAFPDYRSSLVPAVPSCIEVM